MIKALFYCEGITYNAMQCNAIRLFTTIFGTWQSLTSTKWKKAAETFCKICVSTTWGRVNDVCVFIILGLWVHASYAVCQKQSAHCLIFPSSPASLRKCFRGFCFPFMLTAEPSWSKHTKPVDVGRLSACTSGSQGIAEMQTWSSRPSKPRLCGKCWQSCVLHSLYPFSSSLQCTHSGNHWIIDAETGNPFLP